MDGIVDILTGRERRRRWNTDDKPHLVSQTMNLAQRLVSSRCGMVSAKVCFTHGDDRCARACRRACDNHVFGCAVSVSATVRTLRAIASATAIVGITV
jgi:hypothetical protein